MNILRPSCAVSEDGQKKDKTERSCQREKICPLSDVDIAVCLSEDADIAGAELKILGGLADMLNTDEIDLVILNTAPLTLKMRILAHRKVIADNAPFARHAYESLTMRAWFDFSVLEKNILERRFLHG